MKSKLRSIFVLLCCCFYLHANTTPPPSSQSLMPVIFTIENATGAVGSEVCVNILAQNFTDILGMQFTIQYDPSVLEYKSIKEASPNSLRIDEEFPEDNFGLPGAGNVPLGRITFVWDAPGARPVTIAENGSLFELCFTVLSTAETTIELTDTPTNIQVVDQNEQVVEVTTTPGSVNDDPGSSNPPTADFSASSTNVVEGNSINFTDLSTGATSWSWSFPGGTPNTSSGQNPSITYNTPGTYNVTLTATNSDGSDTETKTGYITVTNSTPTFDGFTLDILEASGNVNDEVCIPIKAYNFNAILGMQFTIDYDPDVLEFVTIKEGASALRIDEEFLEDNFGLPGTGNVPLGKITFVWDAPGARPVTITDGENLFEVCFRVKTSGPGEVKFSDTPTQIQIVDENEQSIDFSTDPGGINVSSSSGPNASFTANTTTISVGTSVQFTDQSTGNPTNWSWSFPGGTPSTSNNQNPTVVYNTPGAYNVTLTVSNADGSDTETRTGYIIVTDGVVSFDDFTLDITNGSGEVNEEVCISVDAYKFTDILGMQFTIDYDPNVLDFSRIREVAPNAIRIDDEFPADNFGIPGTGNVPVGKITFVWDAPGAREITLEDGTALFEVCFTLKSTAENGNRLFRYPHLNSNH